MKKFYSFILLIFGTFFFGCEKTVQLTEAINIESHTVSFEKAKEIAILTATFPDPVKKILANKSAKTMNAKIADANKSPKKITSSLSVNYSQNNSTFYIFNYEQGGFSIIAADDRIYPVLAYSDKGSFPIDSTQIYPSSIVGWLSETDEMVNYIIKNNLTQTKDVAAAWNDITIKSQLAQGTYSLNDLPPCVNEGEQYTDLEEYGPYTVTKWSQGVGYNDNLQYMGCPLYSNGKPPVGCVATATAQIMAFHQYPSSFSWSLMPNTGGSAYTAQLMADIGSHIGMDYGCDVSGVETAKAANLLRNNYGYSSATYSDYEYYQVYNNVKDGKPVILKGGRKDKWWFFNVYAAGHAWVCDGVRTMNIFVCHVGEPEDDPYADQQSEWEFLNGTMYFHMNWGWGGSANGWFVYTNFNPAPNTFNYKKGMITNIIP